MGKTAVARNPWFYRKRWGPSTVFWPANLKGFLFFGGGLAAILSLVPLKGPPAVIVLGIVVLVVVCLAKSEEAPPHW